VADDQGPLASLLGFCSALRDGGLRLGTDDAMTYASAAALLNPADLEDLYWSGRVTLVHSRDQIPTYDAVFTRYFLGGNEDELPAPKKTPTFDRGADATFDVPSGERPDQEEEGEDTSRLGAVAAAVVVDRSKSFAECTDEELESLRRIISKLRVAPPIRRTRRRRSSPAGRKLDLRRMARETMRGHGEPGELMWLDRREKPRPLVLILDISGSMADYSRNLLQFAHSTKRAAGRVEVFCFGTRLTRVTPALRRRDPDQALTLAGQEVRDWAGGTQIGASLDEFVRRYARRGLARGAVVVICSDGLDRGDPALLDGALERLERLSHRIVWMNPLKGDLDEYTATSLGMSVALPHVDLLWSGHNLTSLEEFAGALPDIR
jgi:uncharacterized protein with von Willebrand factor type A (vWA) domain